MTERICRLMGVACLLLGLSHSAFAQSATSGAIAGVVKDTTGAVLPGVTVEASSPALIEKVRSAVTDDQGNYKIVDLRPGTYAVTFTLAGFSTYKREGIALSTGFTAQANADLKVGSLEETVTVTGASPVVDIQNVRTQQVLTNETLEAIPTSRGVSGFAAMTVGAAVGTGLQDVGGNRNDQYGFMRIHGSRDTDGRQNFDGMVMNNMIGDGGGSSRQFLVNQAAIQETVVQTSGMSAEAENGGVHVNVVPKDGGNSFKFYFLGTATNGAFQATNVSDFLRSRGVTAAAEAKKIYDWGGGVGGPVAKDKIWFYTAHRWWGSQEYIPRSFYNKTPNTMFYTPDPAKRGFSDYYQRDNSVRFTWQLTAKNKLNIYNGFQRNCQCNYYLEQGTVTPEAAVDYPYYPMNLTQVTWNYPRTNRMLFEAGFSRLYNKTDPRAAWEGVKSTDISITELTTNLMYNSYAAAGLGAASYGTKEDMGQYNGKGAVSYVTGSHAFKTGVQMLHGVQYYPNVYVNQDLSYQFRSGVPVSLTQWASPGAILNEINMNMGIFAQDQWTMHRLTLNLGARYDQVRGGFPDQTRPGGQFVGPLPITARTNLPNFKDLTTRLGAAYDVFGNGRTAVKASIGKYLSPVGPGTAFAVNPANAMVTNATRTWADANGNYVPDCDLKTFTANGECGALNNSRFGTLNVVTTYADDVLTGFGNRGFNWHTTASIQQEIKPGLAFEVAYYRRTFGNFTVTQNTAVAASDFTSFCVTAPTNADLPTSGKQVCGNYDVNLNRFGQVSNVVTQASNFGDQTEVFTGVDFTMNAKFGKGGIFQGGMATGRTTTNNCYANTRPDLTPAGYAAGTPRNADFCKIAPPLSAQTQVKFSASYPLPGKISVAAVYQHLPGFNPTAQVVYTNAQIAPALGRNLAAGAAGTALINTLPAGQLYEQRLNQVDLRFTKALTFGRAKVQAKFDAYNLLNDSTILLGVSRFGPTWRNPSQFLAPRIFKLGAQLDF